MFGVWGMAQKDLRKMSKEELIEIIRKLQVCENALQAERQQLEAQLQQRRIPLQNAGSLVDCGQKVLDLLQQTQEQVERDAQIKRAANADSALYAEAVVKQAKVRAEKVIQEAEQDAAVIQFIAQRAIEKFLKDHSESKEQRGGETHRQMQSRKATQKERLQEIYKRSRASAMG